MNINEFYNLEIGDKVFLRTDIRNIKSGIYKVNSKDMNNANNGCVLSIEGYKDIELHCNFFYTLDKFRKLKLNKLLKNIELCHTITVLA